MTEQTDQLDAESIRWQCPHCREFTSEAEKSVRSHINRSTDEYHKGKSGWSPEQHIPGYDADGHLVAAIRAGSNQSDDETIISIERIKDTEWIDEFATEQQALSDTPEPPGHPSSNEEPADNDMMISRDAFDEIHDIVVSYREIGKREERLAEPGSAFAARAQARKESAGRIVELLNSLRESTSEPVAEAGHDDPE